jgi:hypothetical protein
VRFKNTGKQVIDEADFLGQPYEIVRSDAKLLTFRVFAGSARDSRDLVEKLEQVVAKPETLNVYPKTLNSGDWFTVQLVYDGGAWDQPPTVTGRIRGRTRESAIYPTGEELSGTTEPFIWTAGTFGAFFVLLGALIFVINYSPATHLVGLIIFGAGIVIVMAGVVLSFRSRRRLYARLQAGTQITKSD